MICTPELGSLLLENFSDNYQNEPSSANPREVTVNSAHTNAKTCSTLRTAQERSQESFPKHTIYVTDWIWFIIKKSDAEKISQYPSPNLTKTGSTKYDLLLYLKPDCNDDYRF